MEVIDFGEISEGREVDGHRGFAREAELTSDGIDIGLVFELLLCQRRLGCDQASEYAGSVGVVIECVACEHDD